MADPSCVRLTSAADVLGRYGSVFAEAPIMSNLVASTLLHADECDVVVAVDGAEPLGVAMRWGSDMTLTPVAGGGVDVLGRALSSERVESVTGPAACAYAVAGRWADVTGQSFRAGEVMRVMRYEPVGAPASTPSADGELGLPSLADLDQQTEWSDRFSADVGHGGNPAGARAATEGQIESGRLFTWRVGDTVVSRLIVGHVALGVIRIGGVYTPDEHRGRGYGSALTAAVTARLVGRDDVDEVTLQTQSHEPHTNRMYRRIGFEHVGDLAVAELLRSADRIE